MNRCLVLPIILLLSAMGIARPALSGDVAFAEAFHRHGQTFLTWTEDASTTGGAYNIYRFTTEPAPGDINAAEPIQTVENGSSIAWHLRENIYEPIASNYFIHDIRDGGAPLPDDTGLLVWTPKAAETAWYVLTRVLDDGGEIPPAPGAITGPIEETADPPRSLLIATREDQGSTVRDRAWLHYMDLEGWNPTPYALTDPHRRPVGYAFVYMVLDPIGHDPATPVPAIIDLHPAYDRVYFRPDLDMSGYYIRLDDPITSMWHGWSATHDYQKDGTPPLTGPTVNYTEQRVLRTIAELLAGPEYNIDEERVVLTGFSMGATAAIAMAHRYPGIFSAVYAAQGATNPAINDLAGAACPAVHPLITVMYEHLTGTREDPLAIETRSPWLGAGAAPMAAHLAPFDGMNGWDWADMTTILDTGIGSWEPPLLMLDHGKQDCIISWDTQPAPYYAALESRRMGYTAAAIPLDHRWADMPGVSPAIGSACGDFPFLQCFQYPRSMSFPAFTNNAANPTFPLSLAGEDYFNTNITWSVPWQDGPHQGEIIDEATRWEVTLHAIPAKSGDPATETTADVTPRRRQAFLPTEGTHLDYEAVSVETGQLLTSGTITVEPGGLFTAPEVPILTTGTLLTITPTPPTSAGANWMRY